MPDPLLKLPEDVTTTLFRLIATQLQTDPGLGCVEQWQTWEGETSDITPATLSSMPWVCLTPRLTGESWYSPEAQTGWLHVDIRAHVRGTNVDDVLNLWGAIRAALSPYATGSDGVCFNVRLSKAGAHKGLILMSMPLVDREPEAGQDGAFRAVGSVSVEYRASARS